MKNGVIGTISKTALYFVSIDCRLSRNLCEVRRKSGLCFREWTAENVTSVCQENFRDFVPQSIARPVLNIST